MFFTKNKKGQQMTIDELIENFQLLNDWEDKYRYLIELGERLPAFSPTDKTDKNEVEGCQSQVWITHQQQGDKHLFNATSDAHIVRGLQMILLTAVNNRTTKEIQSLNILDLFKKMGLEEHLSPSRRNGFQAMINRIFSLIL